MNTMDALEFKKIQEQLAELTVSVYAKKEAMALTPTLSEVECRRRMRDTNEARAILDTLGTPPLTAMTELENILLSLQKGAMLLPEQLTSVAGFLRSCNRMRSYLKRAENLNAGLAYCGPQFQDLGALIEEIDYAVRDDRVNDTASSALADCRRRLDSKKSSVKSKLEQILRGKKEYFSESYVTVRSGRSVLPVKREYKSQVAGTVVEISNTGGTYFIEPAAIRKLQDEVTALEVEEANEVIRILYTLTASVDGYGTQITGNKELMQRLDFLFAKAKLSAQMDAAPAAITTERRLIIRQGRHPLLDRKSCVPLDFELGGAVDGVVITGPNTGGKTVALKTVGLLCWMAQSGLHVPAGPGSVFCMNDRILCDIGDGQSIAENLSTFSAHVTSINRILSETTTQTLVLLDELGSGTDPMEGMGLAVAILEELLSQGCLFVATTHYPELKEFARITPRLINARMAFDRESLRPLYRLQLGEAGESCALYIAQRLGLPARLLRRAYSAAYGEEGLPAQLRLRDGEEPDVVRKRTGMLEKEATVRLIKHDGEQFSLGDSVQVLPEKEIGIVCRRCNERGFLEVLIKREKKLVNHKRLKLLVPAEELYPDNYDFSIVFDTVANRKARHAMGKGHRPDLEIVIEKGSPNGQIH